MNQPVPFHFVIETKHPVMVAYIHFFPSPLPWRLAVASLLPPAPRRRSLQIPLAIKSLNLTSHRAICDLLSLLPSRARRRRRRLPSPIRGRRIPLALERSPSPLANPIVQSQHLVLVLILRRVFLLRLLLFVCLLCFLYSNHGCRLLLDLLRQEPRRRAAAAAPGGRIPPLHAVAEHAQPVGQVLRGQVHPGPVGDGHGRGSLPAHGGQEGQGERGGVPVQGGLPEAARREAAQQPDADPRLQEQAAGAGERLSADTVSSHQAKPAKQRRYIPQSAERTLDSPDLVDDYYLNLMDWGSSNVLSIALGDTMYLWDASSGSTSELVTVEEDNGPITSVSWAPDGRHLAIGLNSSDIQLWDTSSSRLLRTLKGVHESRVGSLAWNDNILTTGGMDGRIVNNDVRIRDHAVQTYQGHSQEQWRSQEKRLRRAECPCWSPPVSATGQEVCGLKWSGSGQQLASGGNDNLLHIWDVLMASSMPSAGRTQWLHRLEDHMAAVKALAWCPFQSNLLATGGGGSDRCIKFWNTHTGACLNSVDTGSQVCSLLWNKNERELLSSHGFTQNQLTLWKYLSMVKMAELSGHTSRVLFMAQSPDGCTVASASADETLRFWNVFGTPEVAKPAPKASHTGMFNSFNHIR